MKIFPDDSAFSIGDVDSMSERNSQDNNDGGVQRAPSIDTSVRAFQAFHEQRLVKLEEIAARLSEERSGKESDLVRCVVELVQANERLTGANERLTGQVNKLSLQFAPHGTADLPSNGTIESLVTT
jgi:hypothetical protein